MDNTIKFAYGTKLDTDVFIKKIWDKYFLLLQNNKDIQRFVIDLSDVTFISPLVLPKLCALGLITQKSNITLELILEGNSDIKYYLSQVGFFDLVKKYNILYIDEGLTGGEIKYNKLTYVFLCFDRNEILKKYEKKYVFNEKLTESEKLKVCIQLEIFEENYFKCQDEDIDIDKSMILKVLYNFCSDKNKIREIALDFAEIIHNSIWYGGGICFFALQAGTYNTRDGVITLIEVSVADTGNGSYNSLCLKDWSKDRKTTKTMPLDKFMNLKDRSSQNFYSIIEMILYRKDEKIRGMYDIISNLVERKSPQVVIFNNTISLTLGEEQIKQLLVEDFPTPVKYEKMNDIQYGYGFDISFKI